MSRGCLVGVVLLGCARIAVTGDLGVDVDADEPPRACVLDGFSCSELCSPVLGALADARTCLDPDVLTISDQYVPIACLPGEVSTSLGGTLRWDAARGACFAINDDAAARLDWPPCEDVLPACDALDPIRVPGDLCADGRAGRRFDLPVDALELDEACEGCVCAGVLGVRCETRFLPLAGYGTAGLDVGRELLWPSTVRAPLNFGPTLAGESPDGALHWACYATECDAEARCDPLPPERIGSVRGRLLRIPDLGLGPSVLYVDSWTAAPL